MVVRTAMDGGGFGHGPHDYFPDGWHVFVKKLNSDGSYRHRAKTRDFYQSGCFSNTIATVRVVRKMNPAFVECDKDREFLAWGTGRVRFVRAKNEADCREKFLKSVFPKATAYKFEEAGGRVFIHCITDEDVQELPMIPFEGTTQNG